MPFILIARVRRVRLRDPPLVDGGGNSSGKGSTFSKVGSTEAERRLTRRHLMTSATTARNTLNAATPPTTLAIIILDLLVFDAACLVGKGAIGPVRAAKTLVELASSYESVCSSVVRGNVL